jgi:hypothetical protein
MSTTRAAAACSSSRSSHVAFFNRPKVREICGRSICWTTSRSFNEETKQANSSFTSASQRLASGHVEAPLPNSHWTAHRDSGNRPHGVNGGVNVVKKQNWADDETYPAIPALASDASVCSWRSSSTCVATVKGGGRCFKRPSARCAASPRSPCAGFGVPPDGPDERPRRRTAPTTKRGLSARRAASSLAAPMPNMRRHITKWTTIPSRGAHRRSTVAQHAVPRVQQPAACPRLRIDP